ncbi:MAG: hypothetical protein ACRCX2_13165 [Paraclostridium sp.]
MKKNFYDLVAATAKDLKSRQFSGKLFDELYTAYLNTDTVVEEYKNGEVVKTYHPSTEFRNFLVEVLVEYGADREDAQSFCEEYEFTQKTVSTWARPMTHGIIKGYMDTGKSFKFIDGEDFTGSISTSKVEPFEKTYRGNYGEVKVNYDAHTKLNRSAGAPVWKKKKEKIK